jgi:hypothetical protein
MTVTHWCLARIVTVLIAVAAAGADEWKPSAEYLGARRRVLELGRAEGDKRAQDRLGELEAIGHEVERKFRESDAEGYGRITNEVCGALGALDSNTLRRSYLAQAFAMRALEKANEMPLEVECELVRYVASDADAEGRILTPEARGEVRRQQVVRWRHAWQRIVNTIDDEWDPSDTGIGNFRPPGPWGPAGMAAKDIRDPKLRAEYEAAITANEQKIARAMLQRRARDLREFWVPGAERFIIWSYSEEPERTEELKALLEQYVSDVARRHEILESVKQRRLLGRLQLRNTTQPAR